VQSTIASAQQLADLLGRLLLHLNRMSSPELFRMLGELGLSFTQVKALHLLLEAGDVNVKDVAQRLGMSLPAMSRAVDGLVQRGYVERLESPTDRRARVVRLLPPGRSLLTEMQQARLSALKEFAATLPDEERAGLHASLLPIVERISYP
jgi:DNA-binding MarR family transcriptional regulator